MKLTHTFAIFAVFATAVLAGQCDQICARYAPDAARQAGCKAKCIGCANNCEKYVDVGGTPSCDVFTDKAEWNHCRGCRNQCCSGTGLGRTCCPLDSGVC